MKSLLAAVAMAGALCCAPARADPVGEARALYARFVAAQNAGDFRAVADVLLDSETFLWVTNGVAVWGRDAAIRRMSEYHRAEVWHVEADTAHAVGVELNAGTALMNVPLDLAIGAKAGPDHFLFLVSALCVATPLGWRIAVLFTTTANPN